MRKYQCDRHGCYEQPGAVEREQSTSDALLSRQDQAEQDASEGEHVPDKERDAGEGDERRLVNQPE